MAKLRQPFTETRTVPWLGRDVAPGEVVLVPDAELASWLEGGWHPADERTITLARQLYADGKCTVLEGVDPEPEPVATEIEEDRS